MADPLSVAILVVSTTASKDPTSDMSGPALSDAILQHGNGRWVVNDCRILEDSASLIQRQIVSWCDALDAPNLVVTTGGTGFAQSDITPEAVAVLLDKHAPGLVHAILASSLAITPFAMMSRPVAGVRKKTVIITLPGSPKGATENLVSVIKTLPHACLQAAGANSRALHAGGVQRLEAEAGTGRQQQQQQQAAMAVEPSHHVHGCGQHDHNSQGIVARHGISNASAPLSNDLTLGPTGRHRTSPYPMVSVEDALAAIKAHMPRGKEITVPLSTSLVGAILAEHIQAREDVPGFRASIVDGYAVVVPSDRSLKGVFTVTAVSHAAPGGNIELKEGQVARITTGAPLPTGATAVIAVEDTTLKSLTEDGEEEKEIEMMLENVFPGNNIREVGSDIKKDSLLLLKGERISTSGGSLGLLAAAATPTVKIFRRPVVGILSTGDELVEPSMPSPLLLGQVRDTNRITLLSTVEGWGFEAIDLGIAADKSEKLEEQLRNGLRKVDVLITTGGVSMGELDLLKPTIERTLGGAIHFGRVAMKPGKPTTFATVPYKENSGARTTKPIFSLPGNPASALVTLHLFVLPALYHFMGVTESYVGLPRVSVVLDQDFYLDPRPEFHRVSVSVGRNGVLLARSTGGQRSSRVGSLNGANALVCLPSGQGVLKKGETVKALMMGMVESS